MKIMKKMLLTIGVFIATGSFAQVVNTFPYNEDFEGEIQGSTSCSGTYTMLSPGWYNDITDTHDWTADVGGTGSIGTGPSTDYNPGTPTGYYLYTETSGCAGTVANLESPWFDFSAITGGIEMSFWYHMLGATMGTMSVEYRTGIVMPWTVQIAPFTDDVDLWQNAVADLTSLGGEDSVQFRIVGVTGTSFTSDMAIDDFSIYETAFTGSITGVQDITCFGVNNGEMTAINNYGVAPITYLWDNGDTTATITGLAAGTYCVTMTDANSDVVIVCDSVVDTLATVALNAYAHTPTPWICTDSLGILVIDSITGGVTGSFDCGLSSIGCTGPVDSLQVGTNDILVGGTSYPSPLGNWYWGTRHQMVYRASELIAAGVQPGNLSGLAFFIDNLGTATTNLTGWTIKVGCTPDSVATVFNDTATVEVYPMTDIVIAAGWNWYSFASPYYWNGTDNIIIETCFNNSSYTNNPDMACEITSYTSTVYYRADNATVCGNSSITGTSVNRPIVIFENCSAVPTYNYSYSWNNGSSADTTYVLGGSYTLTVTDAVGCEVQVNTDVNNSAPVNIDDAVICDGNPNDYAATPGFNSYVWNTSETTSTISITTGGTYYVDAVDSLGCPTSDTAMVTTIPTPVISATSSDVMFGNDGYIDLLVYGNAWPFVYDWDNDGTGDNDDTEDQFGLDTGSYTVVVTDTNGCWSTLTITVGSQLGLEDNLLSTFNVYPNPTDGLIYIQPLTVIGNNVTGQILDASGRLVSTITFNGDQIVEVDLSGIERGIYFINITVDDNTATTKIILE